MKKILIKALIVIAAVLGIGTILFVLWSKGAFLPHWILWENSILQDDSGEYKITLAGKKVSVAFNGDVIWISPEGVKVQKALYCDIDHDGQDELVLLCWKKGRYGEVKPIWVEEDKQEWSQHIFVYEFAQDKVEAKWMSSYIGRDISDITAGETREARCCLCLTDTDGKASSWVWDSWGFTMIDG